MGKINQCVHQLQGRSTSGMIITQQYLSSIICKQKETLVPYSGLKNAGAGWMLAKHVQ